MTDDALCVDLDVCGVCGCQSSVSSVYSQRDSSVLLVVSRWSQIARKVKASGWSPPLRTMAAFVSCVQMPVVRGGAQLDLHCWRTVRCLKHQAQSASDGRRARRRAESRPEPARASLLVRRNSWSQLVATSIHEACGLRDACAAAAAPPARPSRRRRAPRPAGARVSLLWYANSDRCWAHDHRKST